MDVGLGLVQAIAAGYKSIDSIQVSNFDSSVVHHRLELPGLCLAAISDTLKVDAGWLD